MLRPILSVAVLCTFSSIAMAHCQVPCGIYGDQLQFEQMLQDEQTISKAQLQLHELSGDDVDAQAINQLSRWVRTKEDHATKIQDAIAHYFLAQRIKTAHPDYVKQLTAAHLVIVNAMKCKQSADPATAKALEKSIFDLYRAYTGKEPAFDHEH